MSHSIWEYKPSSDTSEPKDSEDIDDEYSNSYDSYHATPWKNIVLATISIAVIAICIVILILYSDIGLGLPLGLGGFFLVVLAFNISIIYSWIKYRFRHID